MNPPIALGPCGPVDTVTLDGAAFFVPSSRKSPAAARVSTESPTPVEASPAPLSVPKNVSEVGPDRVVDTGWGKTRPR